jgi:hypothetical protein
MDVLITSGFVDCWLLGVLVAAGEWMLYWRFEEGIDGHIYLPDQWSQSCQLLMSLLQVSAALKTRRSLLFFWRHAAVSRAKVEVSKAEASGSPPLKVMCASK